MATNYEITFSLTGENFKRKIAYKTDYNVQTKFNNKINYVTDFIQLKGSVVASISKQLYKLQVRKYEY